MNTKKPHYKVEVTADESPSLRLYLEDEQEVSKKELMHSSSGAASETVQIYGKAIDHALEHLPAQDLNFLVVGLGLGYIESLIALKTKGKAKSVLSFEIDEDLRKNFKTWIENLLPLSKAELKEHKLSPRDLSDNHIYDKMWQSLIGRASLAENKNYEAQVDSIKKLNLQLKGDLVGFICSDQVKNEIYEKNHVICYDAFSGHTDQHLWSYDFLVKFLTYTAHDNCVFTTYAATSALKKALKDCGFTLYKQKGFAGKRESVFATKGLLTLYQAQ